MVSTSTADGTDPGEYGGLPNWRANNEHVEMVREFVKPSTNTLFDEFLKKYSLTPRANAKVRNLYQLAIHPLLVSGNIPSPEDEERLIRIFNVALSQFPLGLTKFDITPELIQVLELLRLHFINQEQKARKGKILNLLTSNRQEVYQYEGAVQPARRNLLSGLNFFGGWR